VLGGRPGGTSLRGPVVSGRAGPRRTVGGGARQPGRSVARSKGESRGLGGEQVEGRRAVRELLSAGRRRVLEVWINEASGPSPLLDEIIELARRRQVRVRSVSGFLLQSEARSESPQGVLARADPLAETDLEDLVRTSRELTPPFLVALDGLSDPHNLGALLRTAECAGATGAVLPRHRSVQVTPTVAKVAAGAIEHVPIAVVPGIPGALSRLGNAGIWAVGLDPSAELSVFDLPIASEGLVVVLGSEGRGLSRLARQRCDLVVSIPQLGSLESLNVSAAGAVACYEVARRRMSR
jgi:23S rRNA (guanosine2251-2'-O)-methyltransferase